MEELDNVMRVYFENISPKEIRELVAKQQAEIERLNRMIGGNAGKFARERNDLKAEIERLKQENKLLQRQVDKYLPCPDCRDKVSEGWCYRCECQRKDSEIESLKQRIYDWYYRLYRKDPDLLRRIEASIGKLTNKEE